jgi:hypothetical protein
MYYYDSTCKYDNHFLQFKINRLSSRVLKQGQVNIPMYFCGIMANNWSYYRLMTSLSPASMVRPERTILQSGPL